MQKILVAALLSVATLIVAADQAHAQNSQTPKTGNWVVKKLSTHIDGPTEIVARNLTEEQAKKRASELNHKTPLSAPYFFMASQPSREDNTPTTPDPLPKNQNSSVPRPGTGNNAKQPSAKPVDLTGYENLGGYGRVRFRLMPGGRATMFDKDGQTSGTWRLNGSQVVLTFYNGNVVYSGTMQGNRISGTARNRNRTWSFSVDY